MTKFIKFNQKKVAYSSQGRGAAIVLLHGFCEDSCIWDDFKLDLLEKKYRVVCIDFPGFGGAEVVESLSIEYMADVVHAVVSELNIKEFVLVGHSMGGYVSLAFAKKYPDLLKGLGLFHSHPFADSKEKKKNRSRGIDFINEYGHELYVKQLFPTLFPEGYEKTNRFLIDKLTHKASGYSAEAIIEAQNAMANRKDESQVLREIQVPVLFIIGEKDGLVGIDQSLKQTPLPEVAVVHVLEKVGHMGMFESRQKTQIMLRQFAGFCF